jgi:hypothetical protein
MQVKTLLTKPSVLLIKIQDSAGDQQVIVTLEQDHLHIVND